MKFDVWDKFKKWQNPIIILSIILVIVFVVFLRNVTEQDVAVAEVKHGNFLVEVKTGGEIRSVKSVNIRVPRNIRGNLRIVDIVDDGATVKKGDFLVQFDTNDALELVKDQEQKVENANAELKKLKSTIASNMAQLETTHQMQLFSYEQARLSLEQMEFEALARQREQKINLKKAELGLKQALEKIESQKIINRSEIKQAQLKIKNAEFQLDKRKKDVEALTITAPTDGLVVLSEILSSEGRSKVKIGDSPWRGMDLMEIPDLSHMKVLAKVNEVNIREVTVGTPVIITVDALPDLVFNGSVFYLSTLAKRERGSNVKMFDVEILINNKNRKLRPGMTAQCRIITQNFQDKLFIPIASVFYKDDTTVVFKKAGRFKRCPIKVGVKNKDFIIVENGLEQGDWVALHDPTQRGPDYYNSDTDNDQSNGKIHSGF